MKQGYKRFEDSGGDSTSGVAWWLLPNMGQDDDAVLEAIPDLDPYGHYGGPGRSFTHEPCIRRTATRILVTQYGGLDI